MRSLLHIAPFSPSGDAGFTLLQDHSVRMKVTDTELDTNADTNLPTLKQSRGIDTVDRHTKIGRQAGNQQPLVRHTDTVTDKQAK